MFDVEVENSSMVQLRHVKSDAAIVLWNGTDEYQITPGFNPDAHFDVDNRQAVEAFVREAREFIAERNARRKRMKH
jgi:hypothetical protein